jgi:DNA-binding YbaB/EbfC family protein
MDFSKLMKQAQTLQKEMTAAQKHMDSLTIQGSSGGGLVRISLTGKGHLTSIHLDPSLPNDEVLEDLIMAAHQDAMRQLEKAKSDAMGPMGGLANQIPGF